MVDLRERICSASIQATDINHREITNLPFINYVRNIVVAFPRRVRWGAEFIFGGISKWSLMCTVGCTVCFWFLNHFKQRWGKVLNLEVCWCHRSHLCLGSPLVGLEKQRRLWCCRVQPLDCCVDRVEIRLLVEYTTLGELPFLQLRIGVAKLIVFVTASH